jgi:DNA-binding MurR/RpiR family transcriptional regulator
MPQGTKMKTFSQLSQAKQELIRVIGKYVFEHPEETFEQVAARFGIGATTVSRYARRAGLGPRVQGRKPRNGSTTER